MVVFAEFRGATALTLLENAIEIAEVVEAAAEGNLCYGMGAVDQHAAGKAQSVVDDILAEVAPGMQFEETAEGRGAHACDIGYLREAYILAVMLVDEALDFLDAAAVAGDLHLGKAGRSQRTGLELRQLVENREELGKGVKAVLETTQGIDHLIDADNGLHRETESLLCLDHHLLHRIERIAREDARVVEIDIELNGDLADIFALAGILFPDVFQIGARDKHQIVIAYHLVGITHDTTHPGCMLNEVQLVDLMVMDGVSKLFLATIGNVEHVLAHQGRYLVDDLRLHQILSSLRISDIRCMFLIRIGTSGRRSTF